MDILEAIEQRVSVRSYDRRPVTADALEWLLMLSRTAEHLTDIPLRVALVSGAAQTQHVLTYQIGSYGLVLTPPHLLVGVMPEESDAARLDLGYVLEQVVLEATRLGLGTCWIAATFDPQRAGDAVDLAPGEVVAAVVALGYPGGSRWGRFHSHTVRRVAGGRRKPLEKIVFSERWEAPWSPDSADPALVSVLTYARLAPSAHNGQPWRFIVRADGVVLALVRPKPIDAGIVMAHVALASRVLGREGAWRVCWGDTTLARACGLPGNVIPVAAFA